MDIDRMCDNLELSQLAKGLRSGEETQRQNNRDGIGSEATSAEDYRSNPCHTRLREGARTRECRPEKLVFLLTIFVQLIPSDSDSMTVAGLSWSPSCAGTQPYA